jgi:hypothetical protein
MKIYVASSWRNPWQPNVVGLCRSLGHEVYDFRDPNPGEGARGFSWREVDPHWQAWSPERYRQGLKHPVAQAGFQSDAKALVWCDACIAVQPYGTSTAMEVGWAAGQRKRTCVLFPIDMPLTPIGGHSVSLEVLCEPCTQYERRSISCRLPRKLNRVEPELMALLTDAILLGEKELLDWLADDWPKV